MRHHARLELLQQLLGFAAQHRLGVRHVGRVGLGRDQVDTGPRAALDLIEQARSRAIGEHRVLTGAQPEHLLQQQDGFLDRPGTWVGTEVAMAFVHRAAVIGHAWKLLTGRGARAVLGRHAGDFQIRIALVVAKENVVLGVLRLDEVVFEQQRLGLGPHHRRVQSHNLADHVPDARAAMVLAEIAGHPLFQIACLANVKKRILRIEIAIHARQGRQRGDLGQQFSGVQFRRHGRIVIAVSRHCRLAGYEAQSRTGPHGARFIRYSSGCVDQSASIFALFTTLAQLA